MSQRYQPTTDRVASDAPDSGGVQTAGQRCRLPQPIDADLLWATHLPFAYHIAQGLQADYSPLSSLVVSCDRWIAAPLAPAKQSNVTPAARPPRHRSSATARHKGLADVRTSGTQQRRAAESGRKYAFAQTAGKLPLRIPTSSRRHLHRTGAIGHQETFNQTFTRTFESPPPQTTDLRSRSCRSTSPFPGRHDHIGGVGGRQHHRHRRPPYRDRSGK
ncbi:hypothetical protein R69746_08408 [Paraburkholderia aspalathi]|nr:hypothetical protein R69746_08408 [Paraburkholderia aspalathi]